MANEIAHYSRIMGYLVEQFESNFSAMGKHYQVAGATSELKSGLKKLIRGGVINSPQISEFADGVPPLNLDIFVVVINDDGMYEILICEIKDKNVVGLTELSQLIGYLLISNSKFGLLINVDGEVSKGFLDILHNEAYITHIKRLIELDDRVLPEDATIQNHYLGVMKWNSKTNRMDYTGAGKVLTLPQLCRMIASQLG